MSIYTTIARYVARRRSIRAAMQIADLPRGIQKDIGWPDAYVDADFRERLRAVTETPQ